MKGKYMTVEIIKGSREFESNIPREVERKFLPIFPAALEIYRPFSYPVEQFYVSHPSEDFSLRFRESFVDGQLTYQATLKDAGTISAAGIDRMEVTVDVSPQLYAYYQSPATPVIRKMRAEPSAGVIIYFYENGSIQVESENEAAWEQFCKPHGDTFVEITGDHASSNEWQAHLGFRRANDGHETLRPEPELDTEAILRDVEARVIEKHPVVVHIGGRSGSGKSTIVRELQARLSSLGLSSAVMSTDDYHRGNTWLFGHNNGEPWTHWDDPIVYDTATMAGDIENLKNGRTIYRRAIDWTTVEPHFPGVISPSDVLIIEGIYARSADITEEDDLSYEMTTPLATCIGRRLLRDLVERPQFADPAASLSYMLREAEPSYRDNHN